MSIAGSLSRIAIAAAALVVSSACVAADISDEARAAADVAAGAVRDFTAGNFEKARAAWDIPNVLIFDDVAPYLWTGPDSFDRWLKDTSADISSHNFKDIAIRPLPFRRAEVSGNNAYVVMPVVVSYKNDGKPFEQNGLQALLMVRERAGAPWKIRVMAYGADFPGPVKAAGK